MSVDEYLDYDNHSPVRHEYVAGELYAMSGATARHNAIVMNVGTKLYAVAADGPCRVFMTDMRLEVATDKYYYPDVMVVCTPVNDLDVIVRNACAIIEVTSAQTSRTDRGEKLDSYKRVATLLTYLVIDHRRRRVDRYWREKPDDAWRHEELLAEGRVNIPCLGTQLGLGEIYHRVQLPALGEPEHADYEA